MFRFTVALLAIIGACATIGWIAEHREIDRRGRSAYAAACAPMCWQRGFSISSVDTSEPEDRSPPACVCRAPYR